MKRNRKNKMLKQRLMAKTSLVLAVFFAFTGIANAQDVREVRWKSADKVRAMYGEPRSVRGPIGTHASYTLWSYDGFVVAFANGKAFHLFSTAEAAALNLNENRSN